jgi:hypothetical protein
MKWGFYLGAVFCLLMPIAGNAQSRGQIECPRSGGYVYLYSSMTTLDVRTTLQCGDQVQITGRYEGYFGVRTARGDVGYVPLDSLLLLKDATGPQPALATAPPPKRERMAYDPPPPPTKPAAAAPVGPEFILPNGAAVHLKLSKALSSASAHVGDQVSLEVADDVVIEGLLVIPRGAVATGTVTEAETKKRVGGHGGKIGVVINSVVLGDKEKAAIRGYQQADGASSVTGAVVPIMSGRDVVMPQGTEFSAVVDGDIKLKREAFVMRKDASSAAAGTAVAPAPNSSQPQK